MIKNVNKTAMVCLKTELRNYA